MYGYKYEFKWNVKTMKNKEYTISNGKVSRVYNNNFRTENNDNKNQLHPRRKSKKC